MILLNSGNLCKLLFVWTEVQKKNDLYYLVSREK